MSQEETHRRDSVNWRQQILTGVIGLLGVIVGGALSLLGGWQQTEASRQLDIRAERQVAYSNFLASEYALEVAAQEVALLSSSTPPASEQEVAAALAARDEAITAFNGALTQVELLGNSEVTQAAYAVALEWTQITNRSLVEENGQSRLGRPADSLAATNRVLMNVAPKRADFVEEAQAQLLG